MVIAPAELSFVDSVTVELIGQDGNAFNLIGQTVRAITKVHGPNKAAAWSAMAMESGSYEELLTFIQSTVTVV